MVLDSQPSVKDTDFQDLERHDLLTGEPRYIEDEIRNTSLGLVFAGLGFLFALISMIMMWVLYRRDKNRTFLWHAIWMTFLVVFFIVALVWSLMASTAVKTGRQPNVFLTIPVFILSLVFIGYLLVESIWLILYRKVHFDYLVGSSTDSGAWDERTASGYNFTEAWKQHRRMLWWIVFFNLASAVMLGFIVYAARSVSWNRYALARITLYFALLMTALAAFLMIYWVEEAYEYKKAIPGDFVGNLLVVTKAWAIVALVLAVLNALVNMIHNKAGFFLMAALEIGLIIAMVMTVGVILREVRVKLFNDMNGDNNCASTLYSIHQDDLSDRWCPVGGKYLTDTCRKSDLVNRWETDNAVISLNPGCCDSAKFYLLYPFMLVGFWTLVCIFCLGVAATCNLYLADTNEYLSNTNRSIGLIDIIGLALLLIMIIAWAIYFLARKANPAIRNNNNNLMASYNDPEKNKVANFDIVPDAIKQNSTDSTLNSDGCIGYAASGSPIPTFSTDAAVASCNNPTDCVMRVALLTKDSNIVVKDEGGATKGSTVNRQLFFPDCTGTYNDYIFYYGTQEQIAILLKGVRACPTNPSTTSLTYLLYVDQVSKAQIQANGQLPTESAGGNVINNSDGPACGNGYAAAAACAGKCKITKAMTEVVGTAPLKGKLYYIQGGVKKFDIHNQVSVKVYNKNDQIGGTSSLYDGGIFTVLNVPRQLSNAYVATVDISDPVGVFLRKKVDVVVEANTTTNTEISAGNIRLLTLDGNVCSATNATCISGQTRKNGTINIKVKDGSGEFISETSPVLTGVDLNLIKWNQASGQSYGKGTVTANDGTFNFSNIPYDSYTVLANKTGFKPSSSYIDLQDPTLTVPNIAMRPVSEKWDMRVTSFINDPSIDFDLNLLIRSQSGAECTVNPVNKYCPYAAHMNDVEPGEIGEENILVKKLAVASYMSYVSPAPTYKGSCPQSVAEDTNRKLYHAEGWNWFTFKQSRNLSSLNIEAFTFGRSESKKVFTFVDLLKRKDTVESPSEAKVKKRLINRDSQPVIGTYYQDTNFGADANLTNFETLLAINGTVSGNSTTSFTEGDCNGTLTNITYNNNTALGYVKSNRLYKLSNCKNGTNYTNDTATSFFYGIDKSRWDVTNSSFTTANSNGNSIVTITNSNYSYPNATDFTLDRSKANDNEIVGVNTNVSSTTTFSINKTNTNNNYTDIQTFTYNNASSGAANKSERTTTEIEYKNSVLTQNYSQKSSLESTSTGKSGSRNTSSTEIFSFGTVKIEEPCITKKLANGSLELDCNQTITTTYTDGNKSTVTTNKKETVTADINAGTNSKVVNLEDKLTFANGTEINTKIENTTNIVIPNGSNLTVYSLNVKKTDSSTPSNFSRYSYDIDDANKTYVTLLNETTSTKQTNGSISSLAFFLKRTDCTNKTKIVEKDQCKNVTNITGLADQSSCETSYSFIPSTANSTFPEILTLKSVVSRKGLSGTTLSTFSISNQSETKTESADTFNRTTTNVTETNFTNSSREYYKESSTSAYKLGASNSTSLNIQRDFFYVAGTNQTTHNKTLSKTFNGTNASDSVNYTNLTDSRKIKAMNNVTEDFSQTTNTVDGPTRAHAAKVTLQDGQFSFNASSYFQDGINQTIAYLGNNTNVTYNKNYSLFRNTSDGTGDSVAYTSTQYSANSSASKEKWEFLEVKVIAALNSTYANVSILDTTNFTEYEPTSSNQTNFTIRTYVSSSTKDKEVNSTLYNKSDITTGINKDNALKLNELYNSTNASTAYSYDSQITTIQKKTPVGNVTGNTLDSEIVVVKISNKSLGSGSFLNKTSVSEKSYKNNSNLTNNVTYLNSLNYTGANETVAKIWTNKTTDNKTNYSNLTNYTYLLSFGEESNVNSTGNRYNSSTFNLTRILYHPNITTLPTTAGGDNFTLREIQNYTKTYNVSNPATDASTQKWCNHSINSIKTYYRNDSKVKLIIETNTCVMLNNSNVTTINSTYIQVDTASVTTTGTEHSHYVKYVDGTAVQTTPASTASKSPGFRRRILMEKPAKALRTAAHAMESDGNYIFVSCFTGFGTASLINVGQITTSQPAMQNCLDKLAKEKPDFTVEKLKAKYDEYISKNPSAK